MYPIIHCHINNTTLDALTISCQKCAKRRFLVICVEITLYEAVVSSPASCDLNPAPEQSCALDPDSRQQMNTIDFNIFMFALVVEWDLQSVTRHWWRYLWYSRYLGTVLPTFYSPPLPSFHCPISGISRHTHKGGWAWPFQTLGKIRPTRNFCCPPFPLSLWHLFTPLCLNRYRRFPSALLHSLFEHRPRRCHLFRISRPLLRSLYLFPDYNGRRLSSGPVDKWIWKERAKFSWCLI